MARRHKKHRGCNCWNQTTGIQPENLYSGCEHCSDSEYGSLCAYKVLFGCTHWTSLKEKVTEECVLVRKDCPEGCTYSSRWTSDGNIHIQDDPVIGIDQCSISVFGAGGVDPTTCPEVPCRVICYDLYIPGMTSSCGVVTRGRWLRLEREICSSTFNDSGLFFSESLSFREDIGLMAFTVLLGQCDGDDIEVGGIWQAEGSGDPYCGASSSGLQMNVVIVGSDFILESELDEKLSQITLIPVPCDSIPGGVSGWNGGCAWTSDPSEGFKKWILEITSESTATLTGYARSGHAITYETDRWDCYDRSEFLLTSERGVFIGLPCSVCVAPVNVPVDENCSSAFCDDGGSTVVATVKIDCSVDGRNLVPEASYEFQRGAVLPEEVEIVLTRVLDKTQEESRCEYIWRVFDYDTGCPDESEWQPQLGILSIATSDPDLIEECQPDPPVEGADRAIVSFLFCKNDNGDFDEIIAVCVSYRCCDWEQDIAFMAEIGCCCGGIVVDCCEELIPRVLTIEATESPTSETLNGPSLGSTTEVTYDEATTRWSGGSFVVCGLTISLFVVCDPESSEKFRLYYTVSGFSNTIQDVYGNWYYGEAAYTTLSSCDPFTFIDISITAPQGTCTDPVFFYVSVT